MARPDRNACQISGLFPFALRGQGLTLRGVLLVNLLVLLLAGLPMPSQAQTMSGTLHAVTATPAPKPPQTGVTNTQTNINGKSLNNGPQVKPKAIIQPIPTIQQRVPIKPRT